VTTLVPGTRAVTVSAAALWTGPDAVRRPLDEPALAVPADLRAWTARQGPPERLELWGRVDSQLLYGERVRVEEVAGEWTRVVAPAQPSVKHPGGYPGWIPTRQLAAPAAEDGAGAGPGNGRRVVVHVPGTDLRATPGGPILVPDLSFATTLPLLERAPGWVRVATPGPGDGWLPSTDVEELPAEPELPTGEQLIAAASQFVGLTYAAGGTCGLALDCSGLVHTAYRRYGVTVPRDAADQAGIGTPLDPAEAERGDLLFFAKPDTGRVYHVGICLGEAGLLHASERDWAVLDAPMTAERRAHLTLARRYRR
jgi:gamma-D-glutamyl-L-lysine dipeptidyl-peptidase